MSNNSRPKGPSQRMLRVGELVRHALADMLARGDIIDPVIERATITVPEVRMTPDLRMAKAYIMPLGGANAEEVAAALNTHVRYIRGQIVPRLNLRYAPDLRFFVDDTFEEASRIDSLLRSDSVARDLLPDAADEDE